MIVLPKFLYKSAEGRNIKICPKSKNFDDIYKEICEKIGVKGKVFQYLDQDFNEWVTFEKSVPIQPMMTIRIEEDQ